MSTLIAEEEPAASRYLFQRAAAPIPSGLVPEPAAAQPAVAFVAVGKFVIALKLVSREQEIRRFEHICS